MMLYGPAQPIYKNSQATSSTQTTNTINDPRFAELLIASMQSQNTTALLSGNNDDDDSSSLFSNSYLNSLYPEQSSNLNSLSDLSLSQIFGTQNQVGLSSTSDNTRLNFLMWSNLIGEKINATDSYGSSISGTIENVTYNNGKVLLSLKGQGTLLDPSTFQNITVN